MTKWIVILFSLSISSQAFALPLLLQCENVRGMAVLAKDNIPYWSVEPVTETSPARSCYHGIKALLKVASSEDIAQFNAEYEGQIVIASTDEEFAQFVEQNKTDDDAFSINDNAKNNVLIPVIKPSKPKSFNF